MTDLEDEELQILILNKVEYYFLMRNFEYLTLDTQKILDEAKSNSGGKY